jgi:Holliday junction resolvase RusA-like endonuclease
VTAPVPITVILEGTPIAKARPRFGRGHAYTPTATVNHAYDLGWRAKAAMVGRKPFKCAVRVTALFELPVPSSWTTARRNRAITGAIKHTSKPDTDNLLKAALDSIIGIVIVDDALICDVVACKRYGVTPKTILTIQPIPEQARAARARDPALNPAAQTESRKS